MSEWEQLYTILSSRTALEEALDWDTELVDYLMGAWAVLGVSNSSLPKEAMVAMMVGCLPHDKRQYIKNLEKWLQIEYNSIISSGES